MNARNPHGEKTVARLLRAACEVFAEKGYHRATIAEICGRAGVNIAAVNYYFRSKENLYVEAWKDAFHRSMAAHPPDGGVDPDAPPEERLRAQILSLVRRIADPENQEFAIVQKELANPTGLLEEVMRDSLQPIRLRTRELLRELLGEDVSDKDLALCQLSIISQCLHPLVLQRYLKVLSRDRPDVKRPLLALDVEELADHIFRFSLAGIRQMRRRRSTSRKTGTD